MFILFALVDSKGLEWYPVTSTCENSNMMPAVVTSSTPTKRCRIELGARADASILGVMVGVADGFLLGLEGIGR